MRNDFRYSMVAYCLAGTLATIFFWWRSYTTSDHLGGPAPFVSGRWLYFDVGRGVVQAEVVPYGGVGSWNYSHRRVYGNSPLPPYLGSFVIGWRVIKLPIWLAAPTFLLAGLGIIFCRRRFSIRSAMIVTTAVAGLLGLCVVASRHSGG